MPAKSPFRRKNDQRFGLIETLRFEAGFGCIRAERHLARMAATSTTFGRPFDIAHARQLLASISGEIPLRLRLYLDEQDQLTLTSHPFVPVAEGTVWRVAMAQTIRLDPENRLLRHKTTWRSHYDHARAEYPTDVADEVILLNKDGHVCEGTITSVFVKRGDRLLTPPLSDGLLQGVLREELLETGQAIEQTLFPQDLENAHLYVGNSLRGLIPARLVKP